MGKGRAHSVEGRGSRRSAVCFRKARRSRLRAYKPPITITCSGLAEARLALGFPDLGWPEGECKVKLPMMAGEHKEFWQKHPALVWSNPNVDDAVAIRAALLRPRFDRLLDIALEFGTERLRFEWAELMKDETPDARGAESCVKRILDNIEKGFSRAAGRN